jgi:hypothetical protein
MSRFQQGTFTPKNADKYVGKKLPYYRSSWELRFCMVCDQHPNIIQWASEPVQIPYYNPVTLKMSFYIPDFIIYYVDKNNNKKAEMIEIKPIQQASLKEAKTKKDKIALIVNMAKWKAAKAFCTKQGMVFRIMTRDQIFV